MMTDEELELMNVFGSAFDAADVQSISSADKSVLFRKVHDARWSAGIAAVARHVMAKTLSDANMEIGRCQGAIETLTARVAALEARQTADDAQVKDPAVWAAPHNVTSVRQEPASPDVQSLREISEHHRMEAEVAKREAKRIKERSQAVRDRASHFLIGRTATNRETIAADGVSAIHAEREKQRQQFSDDHDDLHDHSELAYVAAVLADAAHRFGKDAWGLLEKHEHDRIAQLRIAGALLAAEIDRLMRLSAKSESDSTANAKSDPTLSTVLAQRQERLAPKEPDDDLSTTIQMQAARIAELERERDASNAELAELREAVEWAARSNEVISWDSGQWCLTYSGNDFHCHADSPADCYLACYRHSKGGAK